MQDCYFHGYGSVYISERSRSPMCFAPACDGDVAPLGLIAGRPLGNSKLLRVQPSYRTLSGGVDFTARDFMASCATEELAGAQLSFDLSSLCVENLALIFGGVVNQTPATGGQVTNAPIIPPCDGFAPDMWFPWGAPAVDLGTVIITRSDTSANVTNLFRLSTTGAKLLTALALPANAFLRVSFNHGAGRRIETMTQKGSCEVAMTFEGFNRFDVCCGALKTYTVEAFRAIIKPAAAFDFLAPENLAEAQSVPFTATLLKDESRPAGTSQILRITECE